MATFKVGQRVRIVSLNPVRPEEINRAIDAPETLGCEATIVRAGPRHRGYDWTLHVDGYGDRDCLVNNNEIAPLTDPKAEQFIERIKKLGNEPMPLVKEPIRA